MTKFFKSLAGCIILFMIAITTLPPFSFAEEPGGKRDLVFSTFPSKGNGELYERILKEAYRRLGYTLRIDRLPGKRALVMANSGAVDGEAARLSVIENTNPNLIRVPTSFFRSDMVVFVHDHANFDVSKGWTSLSPYRIGVLLGYKYVELKTKNKNRVLAPTYESLFSMLNGDRVDVVVLSLFDGLKMLKEMDINNVEVLSPPLDSLPLYHYLHKKNAALVPEVDRVFKEMEADGTTRKIIKEMEAELRAR